MNDDTLKKALGSMGDYYSNMKPGADCPPDDMLLDYVYEDLSDDDKRDVMQHMRSCERCRFEVMKLEADRDGWQDALNKDPDAAMAQALGSGSAVRAEMRIKGSRTTASKDSFGAVASARHRKEDFERLDQATIDRIAAAAAAEVLENVDLHMAYWTKTRGKQPQYGRDTGLAQATGLGGDILPIIADAISRAWEWCVANRGDLSAGVFSSALAAHVSSSFHESKGPAKLSEKEVSVLVNVIAQEVVKAVTKDMGTPTDA